MTNPNMINPNPQQNMLGNGCATPQQALQKLLQDGKINQAQYEQFLRML